MGIPLVWEPPAGRKSKDASPKLEPVAGRRHRSTIRRSPSTRQSSFRNPSVRVSARYAAPPSPLSQEETVSASSQVFPSQPRSPSPSQTWAAFGDFPPLSATTASGRSRLELGQRLLRDTLRHASAPGQRLRNRRDPALRFEMGHQGMTARNWSHPHTSTTTSQPVSSGAGAHRVSYTPYFAPAHPVDSQPAATAPSPTIPDPRQSEDRTDAAETPLLRRVGHRSVADVGEPSAQTTPLIDGLGDRERSFSAEDDNADDDNDNDDDEEMHDTWETLLTTIQPDAQLPSTGTSFASATAASASSALSRNPRLNSSMRSSSYQTPPSSFESSAMHVLLDPFPEFTANCDFMSSSEGSDTEVDDSDDEQAVDHRQDTGYLLRHGDDRSRASRREGSSQPLSESQDTESGTRSTATSFRGDNLLLELQQMHTILDRLVRRDDIPDEWWETAGLSRTIRRELNNSRSGDNNNDA